MELRICDIIGVNLSLKSMINVAFRQSLDPPKSPLIRGVGVDFEKTPVPPLRRGGGVDFEKTPVPPLIRGVGVG